MFLPSVRSLISARSVAGRFFAKACLWAMVMGGTVLPGFVLPGRPAVGGQGAPRLAEVEAIDALRSDLKKRSADDLFSGAVLVARRGEVVFETAEGYADRTKKIPNTVDTRFRFGSMGKMFTAVAILQLVQEGKIKLGDPVGKYLVDYPNQEVASRVTVHQLLTHTGGTGDIFGPEFDSPEIKELRDYISVGGDRAPEFEPGSRHQYSNFGFLILGRIVEVASGQTYYDYTQQHIFEPAGMKSTGNDPEETRGPDLAIGYTRMPPRKLLGPPGPAPGGPPRILPPPGEAPPRGPLRANTSELPYRGSSAGGGYSTVGDLLRFATALISHKLLDEKHTELLITGKVKGPRGQYAYGFEDQTTADGVRRVGHGGGFPGMNGRLSIFPKSGYTVVVLANVDPPAATHVEQFISSRLPLK